MDSSHNCEYFVLKTRLGKYFTPRFGDIRLINIFVSILCNFFTMPQIIIISYYKIVFVLNYFSDFIMTDDIIDILNIVDYEYQEKRQFWKRKRLNPLIYIESDALFKLTYRFSKENVKKLAKELSPFLELSKTARGDPCTAETIVCSGLEILGGHFKEIIMDQTDIGNSSKSHYFFDLVYLNYRFF